jgi:hypothetical protein
MKEEIEFFDYKKLAKEMKIPNTIVKKIENEVKKEVPTDKMLYELHVLRALKSNYRQNVET